MNSSTSESAQDGDCRPPVPSTGAAPTPTDPPLGEPPPAATGERQAFVCPVCWLPGAGCRSKGDLVGCPHCQYPDAIGTTERDSIIHHVYQVPPEPARRFIQTLFEPRDVILFRQVEGWTDTDPETGQKKKYSRNVWDATIHWTAGMVARNGLFWDLQSHGAAREKANRFFGICPRFRARSGQWSWDHACQIRVVRCLWADIDHCTVNEGLSRCAAAGLPPATVVVNSGNGVHVYWRLAEPYLVDDVADPLPIRWETVMKDGQPVRKHDGSVVRQKYFVDPQTGEHAFDVFEPSPKANHIVNLLSMITERVRGDHTTDLCRLLRVPETWNRKNQRHGQRPVRCTLVECDASRRYPLAVFEAMAAADLTSQPDVPADVTGSVTRSARRPTPAHSDSATPRPCLVAADPDDDALIARIRRSRVGSRFAVLFDAGDLSALGNDPSKGDYALCDMLAFWAGPDAERIDRLFRRSRLYRSEKWGRPDYSERTIRKVLSQRTTYWGVWPDENLPQISTAVLMTWGV